MSVNQEQETAMYDQPDTMTDEPGTIHTFTPLFSPTVEDCYALLVQIYTDLQPLLDLKVKIETQGKAALKDMEANPILRAIAKTMGKALD